MGRRIRTAGAWRFVLVIGLVFVANSPSAAAAVVIESPNSAFSGSATLELPAGAFGSEAHHVKCTSGVVKGMVPGMPDGTATITQLSWASGNCTLRNIFDGYIDAAGVTWAKYPSITASSELSFGEATLTAAYFVGGKTCNYAFTLSKANAGYTDGVGTNTVTWQPSSSGKGVEIPYPCWNSQLGFAKLVLTFSDPQFALKEVTFKAPTVTTKAASSITQTGAMLNGEITPNGLTTEYHFEYGLEKEKYGTNVPASDATINSGPWTAKPVPQAVSGLLPGTTYHFRLVAKNAKGTTPGPDETFVTLFPPPSCDPLSRSRIKIGDMNGDSKADIFRFTDPADGIGEGRVWKSEGSSYKDLGQVNTGFGIAYQDQLVDWDGDNDDDVLQFTETGRVDGWRSNTTTYTQLSQVGSSFPHPCEMRIGDMNGDGIDDLLRFSNEGNGYAWVSTGAPMSYTYKGLIGTGFGLSHQVRVGDMDGDGDDDLFKFLDNGNGYAWRSDKTSYTSLGLIATGFGNSAQVRVGDRDGDGDDDLYQFTDEGKGYYWESKGASYTYLGIFTSGFGPSRQVRIADINADKESDILWFRDEGNGYAWLGDGKGGFESLGPIGSGFGVP